MAAVLQAAHIPFKKDAVGMVAPSTKTPNQQKNEKTEGKEDTKTWPYRGVVLDHPTPDKVGKGTANFVTPEGTKLSTSSEATPENAGALINKAKKETVKYDFRFPRNRHLKRRYRKRYRKHRDRNFRASEKRPHPKEDDYLDCKYSFIFLVPQP